MRFLLLALGYFFASTATGQIYNPVKWTFELQPDGKDQYTVVAKAAIQDGWWVYSQHLKGEDGPIPTSIHFDEGAHFKLFGKNKESDNAKKIFDKVFEMEVIKFQKYFTIEQKVKVIDSSKPIKGYLEFMTCDDERCLPPTEADFELFIPKGSSSDAETKDSGISKKAGKKAGDKNAEETASASKDQAIKPVAAAPKKTVIDPEKKKITQESNPTTSSSSTFSNVDSYQGTTPGTGMLNPVKWTFRSEKKSDGVYEIIAEGIIEKGWHIYGSGAYVDGGPVPTTLTIEKSADYTPQGNLSEYSSQKIEGIDQFFDLNVVKLKLDARLTQLIKTSNVSIVSGSLEFMACDETKCLSPEYIDFKIDLAS
ncbi:MAG: protein-disulfide reductase DsbD domain-containing protein, partial [Saprospiraceae bacterium]